MSSANHTDSSKLLSKTISKPDLLLATTNAIKHHKETNNLLPPLTDRKLKIDINLKGN
jgi:hypothetical protein